MKRKYHRSRVKTLARPFIILFVCSAITQSLNLEAFRLTIMRQAFWENEATSVAITAIILELLAAFFLLCSPARLGGFYLSTFLATGFFVFSIIMLVSGDQERCACGFPMGYINWYFHIITNTLLIIAGVKGIILETGKLARRSIHYL